jgi:hypothetical protein
MEVGGYNKEPDWVKIGPSLLVAARSPNRSLCTEKPSDRNTDVTNCYMGLGGASHRGLIAE